MTEQNTRYPGELELQQKVQKAIKRLLIQDSYLLERDVNERSISHKLASYLQSEFGEEWDVDCEYNRDHNIRKELIISSKAVEIDDTNAKTVFPDVIVHHRDTNDNLLVIEMKKASNSREMDFDLQKLQAFKRERYHYCHTFYLQLKTKDDIGVDKMQWDGEWMTPEDNPLGRLFSEAIRQ